MRLSRLQRGSHLGRMVGRRSVWSNDRIAANKLRFRPTTMLQALPRFNFISGVLLR
jgi:hypothetical protein